jgi:folate-binding protein YgfZ
MSKLRTLQAVDGGTWPAGDETAPASYGDAQGEYRAAINGAALVDLSSRTQIEVAGKDRTTFLHNFCTQEVKRLPAGQGAEAFVTNIKGRILGHVLMFIGEEAIWLDSAPGSGGGLISHLDKYIITEDVQLADRSAEWGELAVIGPQAAHIVDQILPGSGTFAPFRHGAAEGITVRRYDLTLQPGWLLGALREQLPEVWQRVRELGAAPCGGEAWEALRIEAGFPTYGVDLTDDNLAHEAGRTKLAISFTKGCYLGQEPIARLDALGHANRELRGIRFPGERSIPAGTRVLGADGAADAGAITSSALAPGSGATVALAMLRREWLAPGSRVFAQVEGMAIPGEVFWNT